MGNQKFRLSDMIPNAWFYKLKDLNKPSKTSLSLSSNSKLKHHHLPPPPPPPPSPPPTTAIKPRKSYHFTRELPISPEIPDSLSSLSPPRKSKTSSKSRKSPKKFNKHHHHQQYSLSSTGACTCRTTATLHSHRPKSPENALEPKTEHTLLKTEHSLPPKTEHTLLKTEHPLLPTKTEQLDIIIDPESFEPKAFKFQLPPIITKTKGENPAGKLAGDAPSRRFSGGSPAGVRLRINSPRVISRKQQGQNGQLGGGGGRKSFSSESTKKKKKRRSISESFAVVKSSDDPQKDFRESMVDMIVQNNLRASKDLEDLLACYLSLNSDEYHDVIIKVFKQIWFDLSDIKQMKFV